MFGHLRRARELLREAVQSLDPEVLEPGSAFGLVEIFSEIERFAAAGKGLSARRGG
jgi:hypothetical protein